MNLFLKLYRYLENVIHAYDDENISADSAKATESLIKILYNSVKSIRPDPSIEIQLQQIKDRLLDKKFQSYVHMFLYKIIKSHNGLMP